MFIKSTLELLPRQISLFKRSITQTKMANSRYEYVKSFELDDTILPNVWIVVRVDGRAFHKFSKVHEFEKPNDKKGFIITFQQSGALNLMNHSAVQVMEEFRDIILGYGQSDEYSFVFRKETDIYKRRSAKLLSYVTSLFTSAYIYNWTTWFPEKKLQYPPVFDGRIVLYPSDQNLRDYLSWRQADVHINNLYNTAFWNLVLKEGITNKEAEAQLRGTFSADKNELLFSKFGINYNELDPMFRKGTILLRKRAKVSDESERKNLMIFPLYEDMIKEKFWKTHPELLGKYIPGDFEYEGGVIPAEVAKQLEKLTVDE